MKERRCRDVRQGIRKGRQERLGWKTGETGLENRTGRVRRQKRQERKTG
jgi:hypothetical protein